MYYNQYKNESYESLLSTYISLQSSIENEKNICEGDYSFTNKLNAKIHLLEAIERYEIINELLIITGDNYSLEEKERANQTILDFKNQEAQEMMEIGMGLVGGGGGPIKKASLQIFKNNKIANEIAQKLGFEGAEDLKKFFVGKSNISKFNIKYDKDTGEIVLESINDSSVQIPTGLYK